MSAYAIPTTSLSYEDHVRLFTVLPPALHKIICATPARIYQSGLQSSDKDWQYTGLKGMLVFGCDNRSRLSPSNPGFYDGGSYWFKLVDCRRGKLVWQHQLQEILEYEADKPFFHAFTVKTRKFGFRFDEDDEAAVFYKEVQRRLIDIPLQMPLPPKPTKVSSPKSTRRSALSGSMISPPVPNSFQHVAHMGMEEAGSRTKSWNVAPEWTHLLEKLGGYGIDAEAVEEKIEFVQGFLAGVEAVSSSPKNSPTSTPLSTPPCTSDEEDDYFHVPTSKPKRYESPRRKPSTPHYAHY